MYCLIICLKATSTTNRTTPRKRHGRLLRLSLPGNGLELHSDKWTGISCLLGPVSICSLNSRHQARPATDTVMPMVSCNCASRFADITIASKMSSLYLDMLILRTRGAEVSAFRAIRPSPVCRSPRGDPISCSPTATPQRR